MKKKWIIGITLSSLFLIGCSIIGPIMSDVEHPDYEVVSSVDNIEIRQYAPILIAEVEVEGERKEAISDGFRLLADYIFGNNTVNQDIAMTAPVQQQANQKIAMTAPVQQQSSGDAWRVSFVMPSKYSLITIPKPNDDRVNLIEISSRKFIVIRFSGSNTNENVVGHEKKLLKHVKDNQIQTIGSPKYAFYNPPWTLPSMRRNEVMIELEQ